MKVVINKCYGGFGISKEAYDFMGVEYETDEYGYIIHKGDVSRTDERLIKCIETIGSERASGKYARLKIVEIPDDIEWEIEDYDGIEWIAEKHRIWE